LGFIEHHKIIAGTLHFCKGDLHEGEIIYPSAGVIAKPQRHVVSRSDNAGTGFDPLIHCRQGKKVVFLKQGYPWPFFFQTV
jgi:hypothetical protein